MNKKQDIAIYGAGGNGIKFYNALKKDGYNIVFFIDSYSNEQEYDGIKIYRPDDAPQKDIQVLVSVSCYSHMIANQLKKQAYLSCYDFNQCIKKFPVILNAFFSSKNLLKRKQETKAELEQITKLGSMLKDEISKLALEKVVAFRLNPSSETYIENDWKVQYFSDDLPLVTAFREPISMLDCGAYIGDTLPIALDFFKTNEMNVNLISLFEPNLDNNLLLQKTIEKLNSPDYLIMNYPCGVWSKNTTLNFKLGADASHIVNESSENSTQLQVVGLDAVAYGSQPNFIKMDIEGAEIDALKGAEKIIKKYTPVLAISVYHLTSHLWEAAFLINQINPNYHYYLRTHGDLGNEIVLYALPIPQ